MSGIDVPAGALQAGRNLRGRPRAHVVECGLVDYQQAWERQREVHARRVADDIADTVLLLEHPPVFTAGRRTAATDRPFDGTPVIDVDRGGKITWHGPGQLVGYPIIKLAETDRRRRLRPPARDHADGRVRGARSGRHDAGRGPQRGLGAGRRPRSGTQGRRHRRPGGPRRHVARLRPQLRPRPHAGTTGSSRAGSPTPASPRSRPNSAATITVADARPGYATSPVRPARGPRAGLGVIGR